MTRSNELRRSNVFVFCYASVFTEHWKKDKWMNSKIPQKEYCWELLPNFGYFAVFRELGVDRWLSAWMLNWHAVEMEPMVAEVKSDWYYSGKTTCSTGWNRRNAASATFAAACENLNWTWTLQCTWFFPTRVKTSTFIRFRLQLADLFFFFPSGNSLYQACFSHQDLCFTASKKGELWLFTSSGQWLTKIL